MERFFNQQNIERFRRLVDKCTDEAQRRRIFKSLSEEQERFKTDANEKTLAERAVKKSRRNLQFDQDIAPE